jgi:hypothetical protein
LARTASSPTTAAWRDLHQRFVYDTDSGSSPTTPTLGRWRRDGDLPARGATITAADIAII